MLSLRGALSFKMMGHERARVVQRRMMSKYIIKNEKLWMTSSYIGGKWTNGRSNLGDFPVHNPATGALIANCARMGALDVADSAEASHEAWKSWKRTLASDRSKFLRQMSELMRVNSDDLAYIITQESGKPFPEAKGEVNYARSFLDYYAEESVRIQGEVMETSFKGQKMMTVKQSVGPAALITPWNFPAASEIFYFHTECSAVRNSVINYTGT